MLQVVIVGDRDSGKTTFLGLLYAAQVKSGSDKADDFRFHATLESLEEITVVFQRLMSGSFPDTATKEGIHEISFQFGYRRPGLGILSLVRSREWAPSAFATFRFILLRTLEHEISRLLKGSSVADGKLRDVFDGDAFAILVDSTKLAVNGEDPQLGPMGKYDAAVESLLTAIQRWREHGGRGLLYPIFILSKFDRVRPEVLRAANVEAAPPRVSKRGPRASYAEALLENNLPRTLAKVRARERGGLRFAIPSYFFSWVRTEGAVPGRSERVRLQRSRVAGWEPDYSRDEYLAFLECLWDIAARAEE